MKNEKMKFYDKKLTKKSEDINKAIWIIVIFTIGFAMGCLGMHLESKQHINELENSIEEKENKIFEQYVELDSLRETIYMYEVYGK